VDVQQDDPGGLPGELTADLVLAGWTVERLRWMPGDRSWYFDLREPPSPSALRICVRASYLPDVDVLVILRDGSDAPLDLVKVECDVITARGRDAFRAWLAEAISRGSLTFVDCAACMQVRQLGITCQGETYCTNCEADHFFTCPTCLAGTESDWTL
jgi:hypothetical protein